MELDFFDRKKTQTPTSEKSAGTVADIILIATILCVASILVWIATLKPVPALFALFEQRHRLAAATVVIIAVLLRVFLLRSYKSDFDFSQSNKLAKESMIRVIQRSSGLLFCLIFAAPFITFEQHKENVEVLYLLVSAFALLSPAYFLLLERFGREGDFEDELLLLGRRICDTVTFLGRGKKLEQSRLSTSSLPNLAKNVLLKYLFVPTLLASSFHFWSEWENYVLQLLPYLNQCSLEKILAQNQSSKLIGLFQVCLMQLCFAAGTTVPCAGYLLSNRLLGNQVRSTDCSFSGWFFMLFSYWPACILVNVFLARTSIIWAEQLWQSNFTLTFFLSSLVVGAVGLNTCADLCLGLQFSNVSYRGVVQRGLYGIVRHPAYAAKLVGWAIALVPSMISSELALLQGIFGWLALLALYVMRALTEERHLKNFEEYKVYCRKVRFRFIPYLI